MHKHHSALGLATALRPVQPVTLIRPHAAERAARFFVEKFPGRSLYAVKANPSPDLLQILWASGITHYDVASITEVRMVAKTLAGQTEEAIAINEVSLLRETQQAAKLQIAIDGVTRLEELICDGVIVSTPAGSTPASSISAS